MITTKTEIETGAKIEVDATPEQQKAFLGLFFKEDEVIEFRLIAPKESGLRNLKTMFRNLKDVDETFLANLADVNQAGYGIYFGVNPRARRRGKKEDVLLARSLFVDFDHVELDEAIRRVTQAKLPPISCVVASGHGFHFYWLLEDKLDDLDNWTLRQKGLILRVNSDPVIHDAPRIMRLPGFMNTKGDPWIPCQITEMHPDRVYSSAFFPEAEDSVKVPVAEQPHVATESPQATVQASVINRPLR